MTSALTGAPPNPVGSARRLAYGGAQGAPAPHNFELQVPGEPVWVQGAADLLAQMLDKLVENAVDFASSGTAIRISLSAEARLRVENRGPPLPDAIRESLFDSMVSLRAERKDGTPHLGLGLYICKGFVEAHGGRIWVESEVGQGSAFHIALPLEPMPADRTADELLKG